MWLSVSVVIVMLLCVLISRVKTRKYRMPPEYPGALPIVGHGHLFASIPFVDVMKDIAMTSLAWGGVVSFRLGPKLTYYMISDPEDCVTIANSCLDKDYVYDFMRPVLGEGLLTGRVQIWKSHRKLLMPAFNQMILDGFIEVFNSQGRRLVEGFQQFSEGKPMDCWGLVQHNALETICLTAMGGMNANDLLSEEYLTHKAKATEVLIKRFQRFWLHSEFIFNLSPLKKTWDEAVKNFHNASMTVIRKKREEPNDSTEKSGTKFKAFIDLILELSGDKGLLTDQEIREEVDTIILAGHETTALSLTYTLILLGSHPEEQERVFQEISEIVGERDVEKQDLSKLVYLEAVVKESLRLYPVGPYVARKLTHDVKIRNYTLPAGSGVYIAIYALHRHAQWGADAAQFAPARWLTKTDHAAYAPFSIGKRNCIGKTYAMMGMKTTLVHLIRNFRFTSDVSKLKLNLNILMEPSGGHQITIERRK